MSERPRADLEELVDLVAVLRDRCPWDARQTPRSLVTYLIEETGEVVDAVEVGTDEDLVEELGDLLLQVVLHARIAEQQGRFDIRDVAGGIVTKLRRRHPQFFPDGITLS
ncbi:MazG nucleotide pyrophosphohydrolase domain-containing protein, partial [Acidipropionibacterium jensenii]